MNRGKCKLKLYRARLKRELLVWYCTVDHHYHGRPHPIMSKLTEESCVVPADEFYAMITKETE